MHPQKNLSQKNLPIIGIPCREEMRDENRRPIYYNNRSYSQAVESAGGVPIFIPILEDLQGLYTLLPTLDGLLLSGGIDVEPSWYQEEPHALLGQTSRRQDELEMALARWAVKNDIPVLGICRGMQLLNVAQGGKLYQDLPAERGGDIQHGNWKQPRNKIAHQIIIEPGSKMEQILKVREVPANTLHHQAVKEAGEGIRISGYAEDGVAEMLEMPTSRFAMAVQCHPEELYCEHPVWSRLFEAFIEASRTTSDAGKPDEEALRLPRAVAK